MLSKLEGYDYVIIDCPPAVGAILQSILVASDEVIIPVTADRYSLQGLSQIWETIQNIRQGMNTGLRITGFLLVKYNTRTNLNKDIYTALEEIAEDLDTKIFETYIRESTKAREALAARQTLISYAPKATTAEDYVAFVEEFLNRTKR